MSLQGPILIVGGSSSGELVQVLMETGAFPVIEATWRNAKAAVAEINPSVVVTCEPEASDLAFATALMRQAAGAQPILPLIVRATKDRAAPIPGAATIDVDAPTDRLIARLSASLRLRALHATVIGRARTLKSERNIVAEMPDGDPLDDATVLLVGRGRHHATLSVAVGERMGVMGALSIDAAARCLTAREVDGIVIGDGLPMGSVDAFLAVLGQDSRFRDLPVAVLGDADTPDLPNLIRASDPHRLIERAVPLVALSAFESTLKRLLKSIECKGMLDARTGLLNQDAFGRELDRAINDAGERGVALSLARFSFESEVDRRASMDAARLVSRLVRDVDFACRQDDGSILFAFADTDLRSAHVVARRLASVLRHTMLQTDKERPTVAPGVTLATLKPSDSPLTLLSRVSPRPVAAA
jgi:GGDEF domain-containing protein